GTRPGVGDDWQRDSRTARIVERLACGEQQFGRVVVAELPYHQPAESSIARVACLERDGDWVVVGPEGVTVEEPRRLRDLVAVDRGVADDAVDEAIGTISADALPLLEEAVGLLRNLAPAVGVEGNSHQQLRHRHAGLMPQRDGAIYRTASKVCRCRER